MLIKFIDFFQFTNKIRHQNFIILFPFFGLSLRAKEKERKVSTSLSFEWTWQQFKVNLKFFSEFVIATSQAKPRQRGIYGPLLLHTLLRPHPDRRRSLFLSTPAKCPWHLETLIECDTDTEGTVGTNKNIKNEKTRDFSVSFVVFSSFFRLDVILAGAPGYNQSNRRNLAVSMLKQEEKKVKKPIY